jgi:hypothetical protein
MRKSLILIFFLVMTDQVFSNGGPIVNSLVFKTGQIQMMHWNSINIINENIDMKIEGEYTVYNITYTLENKYPYTVDTIMYGFPVDFISTYWTNWGFDSTDIPYFEIYFNGEKNNCSQQTDYCLLHDTIVRSYIRNSMEYETNRYGFENDLRRRWYITKLIFEREKKENTLNVKYKIHNYSIDFSTMKSTFITYDKRKVIYDFSAAGYWGDGIIDKITINIDVKDLDSNYETHDLTGIEGYELKNGIYTFQKEKFDPNKDKYLMLVYTNKARGLSADILKNYVPDDRIDKINTAFTGKTETLNDFDFSTFCVLKKDKIKNSWLEYNFKNNTYMSCITILNGNYTSEADYYNNSRIKKVKIEFEIGDWKDSTKVICRDTTVTLKDRKYNAINKENFAYNSDIVHLNKVDYVLNIKKIKITFLETYPGIKNDDAYLTELVFNSYVYKWEK